MDHDFSGLIDAALAAFWRRNPVTATFAGEADVDGCLPRADAGAEADECRELDRFAAGVATATIPADAAARIDARHLDAYCAHARSAFARRARYRNPAWYTGEAVFGLVSLLLAKPGSTTLAALRDRIAAIPAFFADGAERLHDEPIPAAWVARAQTELGALARLVHESLPLHPLGTRLDAAGLAAIPAACERFAAAIATAPDADAACGAEHLALVINRIHGLPQTPAALEREAATAFERLHDTLVTQARQLDAARTWREQIARLGEIGPGGGDIVGTYAQWHERALHAANDLLTPAAEYGLTFAELPPWARPIAADLYFLFYRSPAARAAGSGSTYWVTPPHGSPDDLRRAHNTVAVKLVHAVHHGSIGHHTQNARARAAGSRFARIAGTDGASGIALLSGGTMVEGWACYAEDLLAEVPHFYTAEEELALTYFEFRNVASCLADLRFHLGNYSLEAMRRFYRDDAAFAPARVAAETTRNSMFPGSRVMYWTGTQQIKALRAASPLPAKAFHDRLLAYGAAPIAWIADEFAR